MSGAPDPEIWKQAADWLWAVLLVPVAALWKKVDNSASKEELLKLERENRENFQRLFEKAESAKTEISANHADVTQRMHAIHLDLIGRMEQKQSKGRGRE